MNRDVVPNILVFLAGLMIAVIFTFGWKIFGGLRKLLTGKTDTIDDEVRTFDYKAWLRIGIGAFLFFLLMGVGSFFNPDESIVKYNIIPILFPIGFAAFFPLLNIKSRLIEKMRNKSMKEKTRG